MRGKFLAVPVAVVGALLVGGAVTGTTLALWQDTVSVNRGTVSTSGFGLTVDNSAAANLGTLPTLQPGESAAVEVDVKNTGTNKAQNLKVDYYLDTLTSSNTALNGVMDAAASIKVGAGACVVATTGFKPVGPSYTATKLTTTTVEGGRTEKMCLTVRLPASAPAGSWNQAANLTFTFSGRQVRP